MESNKAKQLLEQYRRKGSKPQENELVERWYNQLIETGEWQWENDEKEQLQQLMEARLLKQINEPGSLRGTTTPILRKTYWWAAASVILFLSIGACFVFSKPGKQNQSAEYAVLGNDVKAPETNRAMVTLANGQKIYLDSSGNGTLATQGNVKLVKLANGEIAYQSGLEEMNQEIQFNTLLNPRGSKVINMTLSDGSKVWLNAGSSLTYPVAFNSKVRSVSITGEAYFEVVHDAAKPFNVSKDNTEVEVLGTHFNINAYDDESDIKVTLLEGAVKVNKDSISGMLKPGQQARVTEGIKINNEVDLEVVMAWKDGRFDFGEKTSIEDIMRQLARWYDVEVEYRGKVTQQFWGTISRDVNAGNVFKKLEATGGVHFKMEGKKVIVMP